MWGGGGGGGGLRTPCVSTCLGGRQVIIHVVDIHAGRHYFNGTDQTFPSYYFMEKTDCACFACTKLFAEDLLIPLVLVS